jgi:Sulfotransferase family
MPAYRINGRNILFIHVPKTGGTTVETCLSEHAPPSLHSQGVKLLKPGNNSLAGQALPLQHFHAKLLQGMFAPGFFDYAFMIVRDPLERLKSEYRYCRKLGRADSMLPFGLWVDLMLRLAAVTPGMRSNHYRPQADFLCFDAEIFRFEDGIDKILGTVSERAGLAAPSSVPHMRRSDPVPIDAGPRWQAKVRQFYAADYERFGY